MKKIINTVAILFFILSSHSSWAISGNSSATTAKNIASQTNNLNPKVVQLAIEAYYRAKQSGIDVKKSIITVIDYTLPSTQKRLWVIDLGNNKILHTSLVAHGKHSGENYTTSFSNTSGSLQTSIGVFLTENTYFGRDGYSLYLQGLERGFNDKAKTRTIVLHGAPYVNEQFAKTYGRIGHSWGCPAVEKHLAEPIINTIKNGSLIFSYYNHPQWLKKSKFVNQQG